MSIDINKQQVDIENLKKQNELDLNSIKELYKRIEELGKKITQIKYIDSNLANKLKKEYESLVKFILDENIQLQLNNKIDETKTELKTELNNKTNIEDTQNIQQQINNLVLGAVGDGNNAEVVQARGLAKILNERFRITEQLINFDYINLLNTSNITSINVENNFPFTNIITNNEVTLDFSQITSSATQTRQVITANTEVGKMYLLTCKVKLVQSGSSKITFGFGKQLHPNSYGVRNMYSTPSESGGQINTNDWYQQGALCQATNNVTTFKFTFESETKNAIIKVKDFMMIDVTDIYENSNKLNELINTGYIYNVISSLKLENKVNEIKDYVKSINFGIGNVLYGKKWCACGDSVTYGYSSEQDNGVNKTYQYYIGKRNNMTIYTNAISGSTMTNVSGKNPFSVDRYKNLPIELDYITLWFGINDSGYSTLGTINDTENTTFYGAYKIVLNYLIENYPTTKIGLVCTYGATKKFKQAIIEIAHYFGIPYLDFNDYQIPLFAEKGSETGINSEIINKRKNTFLADGTHPNDVGYQYLSTFFENWLRSL